MFFTVIFLYISANMYYFILIVKFYDLSHGQSVLDCYVRLYNIMTPL